MNNGHMPVYPQIRGYRDGEIMNDQEGITTREWMATHILAALVAGGNVSNESECSRIERALSLTDGLLDAMYVDPFGTKRAAKGGE